MEELQKALIIEIGKELKFDNKNVELLDTLDRLLGTVSSLLLNKQSLNKPDETFAKD